MKSLKEQVAAAAKRHCWRSESLADVYESGFHNGATESPLLARALEALTSISKNSCCDTCQEAKLWALKALKEIEAAKGEG